MFERQTIPEILLFLLPGLVATLRIAGVVTLAGIGIGAVLGCLAAWSAAPLRGMLFALLTVARGIPVLVQLYVVFFGLPALGIALSASASAVVALGFFMSLTTMEIVRGGIAAVPRGQLAAARALGLTAPQSAIAIVLPQALRLMLPNLVNQVVLIVKGTSIVSFVGVADVMLLAKESTERTQMGFETMGLVWLLYTALCLPLTIAGRHLQRALDRRGYATT